MTQRAVSMKQVTESTSLQHKLVTEIKAFKKDKKTCQLATVDENGKPNVSYAPFICTNEGYYILISEMAKHTQNILINHNVSLMIIEDESQVENIYARTRLTFDTDAILVSRETEERAEVIALMELQLGEVVETLVQLTDFHLIHLRPEQGLFIKGFGQAYQVAFNELFKAAPVSEDSLLIG